ncbi:hypothetical protein MJO28_015913 [Puccinia striiformis f. sp. tritici]|uniref:Uncharacterized protein n=1 Tax=Puccinia striiformis f. sp. tritici TaxID=168172 RepID=A0ACC0DQ36_9BASI|nr:hypothetical protein MJO28_015913 [Puccinia striiformis f. sp. tritici]
MPALMLLRGPLVLRQLILLWTLSSVSTTIISNLKSGIWDECPVGNIHLPACTDRLFRTVSQYPFGNVITSHPPQPWQSPHSHLLSLLGPPQPSAQPSDPTATTRLQQEIPWDTQTDAKADRVETSIPPPASSRQPPTNVGGPSSHVPSGPSTTNADVILPPARRKLKNGRLRLGHYEPQVPIAVGNESTGRVAAIPVEKTSTFKAARPRSSTLSAGVLSPQGEPALLSIILGLHQNLSTLSKWEPIKSSMFQIELPTVSRLVRTRKPPSQVPKYKVTLNKLNHPSRLYFSSRGLIHLYFLKQAYERFKVKLGEAEYTVVKLPHQSRPPEGLVAMYQSDAPLRPQKVARVIRSLTDQEQSILQWLSLYKVLIGWVYERHEETLNSHNLPAYLYRHQQEKLTSWLEDQIFAPRTGGPPIMGRYKTFGRGQFRWEDHKLSPPQIELSKYFAQEADNNLLAPSISSYLVKEFEAEHQIDYMASNYPSEVVIQRMSASPEFQTILSFVTASLEHRSCPLIDLIGTGGRSQILMSTFKIFDDRFEETSLHYYQLKSLHPKLPVGMFFINTPLVSNIQLFRVLYREDRSLVQNVQLLSMFKKLCKAMNFFHIKFLALFDVAPSEFEKRTQDLFTWLIRIIFESTEHSLCVFGQAKINRDLAPWEDIDGRALNVYGDAQLELIEYFSEKIPNPNLPNTAMALLLLWLRDHHSYVFERLTLPRS